MAGVADEMGLEGRIAIVGMAGRFPGARDLAAFWKNLREGVESVRFLSDAEMAALGVPEASRRDPAWVPAVAMPEGIEEFDAPFFGVSHREAEVMDPQHRLFLEACWAALEDAGHVPGPSEESEEVVSVYGGSTLSTYLLFHLARNPGVLATVDPLQLIVGNAVDSLATRVSYKLGLKGASHAVQCACSTSLVAVHLACQALLDQECDLALAGGVSINVSQRGGYRYQEDSILSPDGHCRAFDAAARGTVFGGGVGVVALKRLEDALAGRDPVRAVILGTAVNNDGTAKAGFSAPSVPGQAEVITEALAVAGIDPETVSYVEAHGTGTSLGDPIEVQALAQAFRPHTSRRGFCALGTVKANVGHLDIAAGAAGLIKTVLALENREIPPSLNFETPNPRIDFAASPFYVNQALAPWPAGETPRRAGVSSFGFGGTNAHVVLEEAPAVEPRPASSGLPWRLLVLSARTEPALAAAAERLADHLDAHPELDLGDVSYTLLAGRQAFEHRRAVVCRTAGELRTPPEQADPALLEIGRRWAAGQPVDLEALFAGEEPRKVSLPTYPFERHRYWIEPAEGAAVESAAPARQALHPRPDLPTAYVAPRDEAERRVAALWSELLGVEEVGVHDSFLELGGDSLLATRLLSRLREELRGDFSMERLFEAPTVAALAADLEVLEEKAERIPRQPRRGPFPLSFAQQRLWFLDRLEPGSPLYNIPAALDVEGRLDPAALEASLRAVVARHEALRTTFAPGADGPVQVVHPEMAFHLPVEDLRHLPAAERRAEAERRAAAECRRPFDVQRGQSGPLLRGLLLRLGDEEHRVVLTVYHIVADGWSLGVLVRELVATAAGSPLPELPIQYGDFAVWQREWLTGEVLEAQLAFWRERLAGAPTVLELPTDHPRPAVQTFRGAQAPVALPPPLVRSLREAAHGAGATLFMAILAAFEALLARHAGAEELLVGTPIANRNRGELEGLIGFFVNTLPMRGNLRGDPSFGELLGRVREAALAAHRHQDLPFEKLVEELHPERDLSRPPLVQVMFTLQPAAAEALEMPGLRFTPRDLDTGVAKFELTLHLAEGEESVAGWIEYNTALFEPATAARFAHQLLGLLGSLAEGLDTRLSDLPLLLPAERQALLVEWNDVAADPLAAETLHSLFEESARRWPQAVAVEQGERRLTYAELERRANGLARHLRSLGVTLETRVGLSLSRTPERIVALLAVLKAGGAYVPLDPAYPSERLAFMAEDSGAALVLTEEALLGTLPESGEPLEDLATAENLAYVIYTSGSTGRPKGVLVRHGGAARVIAESARRFGFGPGSRVPQLASLSFDASVLEIFTTLAAGGTLLLLPDGLLGSDLAAELRRQAVTSMVVSPALLDTLPGELPALRSLTVGGEACSAATAARWSRDHALFNCYAPTEATIYSLTARCAPGVEQAPPLGRPIAGARALLLDADLRPVPLGAVGEIYVGGDGVARGYHDRPDLTAERFVPDPWSGWRGEPGARLYRTGDLGRYRPDGSLEFAGRNDTQVKLRGFRIELGEVETALARHPAVERAVAVVREDVPGDRRLVAYAVTQAEPAELRAFLKERLPEFMVPSAVVPLKELPLTPTGKPDRKALPAPEGGREASAAAYAPPRNELERAIAGIWREVLHVERVGSGDNFFDLGGHSLLLAQVQTRLSAVLGRELALLDLFKHPTVGSLAAHLAPEEGDTAGRPGLERAMARREAAGRRSRDIAIVGMACRFPGAHGTEAFWENLAGGTESITFFTEDELRAAGVSERDLADPHYVRARGVVEGVEMFDAPFFGYSPREAEVIDPQQRLFLECAWEAFEDAGHDPAQIQGDVGVFAGVGMNTYVFNLLPDPEVLDSVGNFQVTISNDKDFLAPRVSYKLGLRGPSLSVQTACSTSLVAVHLACQSLLAGECDAALAGGVSIRIPQAMGHHHREGAVFSPDGHCRAFDAAAGGFVGGNGAGVVLLKRLEDALADGDPIRAVLKGTAVNNDGSVKVGFTAPSVDGQAQVIAQALAVAGVEPETVSYVEAHGTGTDLGDPIEIAALTQAFGPRAARGGCAIGSVKTNIGHLDSAAGVAGLIKAALALERRAIPPTLHFERANPKLELEASPFRVNDRLTEWPAGSAPRRAGVSSMGIGGTNAHVVLEEAPEVPEGEPGRAWHLLPLSARGEETLGAAVGNLARYLARHPEAGLADAAYTLQAGRRRFERRAVALCQDTEDAVRVLEGGDPERLLFGAGDADGVAFLFSGQGSQHPGMAAELYAAEPAFREQVDLACGLLAPRLGLDLRELLFASGENPGDTAARLARTELTQPALFVIEHALARQWMAWGVRPAAMLGHSIGEYVAACLAGVLSLEDALLLVAERGRLMGEREPGAMLAVSLPEAELAPLLPAGLALAAVNAPARTVVSGPEPEIEAFARALDEQGVRHRRLHTSHAFHSAMMEPALAPFREVLQRVRFGEPSIPWVSNVTGTWITAAEAADPEYWVRHLRGTVRFADGLAALLAEPGRVLLEVGPGNALATLAREAGAPAALASLPHPSDRRPDLAFLLTTLGRLWLAGAAVDWEAFHAGERRRRIPLPTYPFERRRYWIEGAGPLGFGRAAKAPSLAKRPDPADWLYAPAWKRSVEPAPGPGEARRWLVLADDGEVGERLAGLLRDAGREVEAVRARGFSRADYAALLGDQLPEGIVHLPALDEPGSFEEAQARGFADLIALAQALGDAGLSEPFDLVIAAQGLFDVTGDEALCPEKATLLGPARVLPWEVRHVRCRVVDAALPEAELASRLFAELGGNERVVALRGARRWVPSWEPVRLEGAGPARLREEGVYLIAGGSGGLGLEMARAIAQGRRAKLALLSRTPAAPAALVTLEEAGAEVMTVSVDVADREALAGAVAAVRERFGAIHGVVHAAGVPGGGLIQRHTPEESRRVLGARVEGLRALDGLFRDEPLDFFVATSAAGALSGEPGQVDLCAAGAFTDAWAQARARRPGGFTVAIDWDPWREVGMAAGTAGLPEELRRAREQALATAIAPAEGREVFTRVVERAWLPQVVVSTKDLSAVLAHLAELERGEVSETAPGRAAYARPELASAYVAPRDPTEEAVAALWSDLLGVDRVGVHDNFFDLGGHSLLATQVLSRVREELGTDLPLDALFAAPTVAGMAEELARRAAEREAGDLEALLREIEALSPEEARAAYAEESDERL
jgi:amino acid adenylation domain-containing protein